MTTGLSIAEKKSAEIPSSERSLADWTMTSLVSALAVLYLLPLLSYSGLGNDEGIAFQGAVRILNGELPYRDFFSFYTPGAYYLYAAIFWIFGVSFTAARVLLLIYAALFSGVTYLLARRTSGRAASAFIAVLLALIALPSRFQNLHNWDSTAAALCALYAATMWLETSKHRWGWISGIFAGCTGMIDQSKGAGIVLGLLLCAAILRLRERSTWPTRRFAPLACGIAVPVAIGVLYFAVRGSLREMIDGVAWPLRHYTTVNKLPYGYLFWKDAIPSLLSSGSTAEHIIFWVIFSAACLISLLPLLVVFIFLRQALPLTRSPLARELSRHIVLGGSVTLGMLLTTWATGRADYLRIVYLAPLYFYLLPLLTDERTTYLPSFRRWQPLVVVYLLVSFVFLSVFLCLPGWTARERIVTRRGAIFVRPPEQVIPYIQNRMPPGSKLMVYPYAVNFSFFSATFNPTYYDFLQVGMHTQEDFARAQKELQKDNTEAVLFDLSFRSNVADVWPSTPAAVLASDPLGDYILAHYRPCMLLLARGTHWSYRVRNDLSCPTN